MLTKIKYRVSSIWRPRTLIEFLEGRFTKQGANSNRGAYQNLSKFTIRHFGSHSNFNYDIR